MRGVPFTLLDCLVMAYEAGEGDAEITYVRPHLLFGSYFYSPGDFFEVVRNRRLCYLDADKRVVTMTTEINTFSPPVSIIHATAQSVENVREAYRNKLDELCLALLLEAGQKKDGDVWFNEEMSPSEAILSLFIEPVFFVDTPDYLIGVEAGSSQLIRCVRKEPVLSRELLFTSYDYHLETTEGLAVLDCGMVLAIPK